MTGPVRVAKTGGDVLPFTFAGKRLEGKAGDTIASALLANGITTVGRSFKYRRPRGIMAAGEDEPNAIVDVTLNGVRVPNVRATMQALEAGMQVSPVLGRGAAWLTKVLSPFIASGFYYKTFLWPHWHLFEPAIRRMAGLGRIDPDSRMSAEPGGNLSVDLCVVGAGRSGLRAAIRGTQAGRSVLLVERQDVLGGSSLWRGDEGIAGLVGEAKAAGVVIWTGATAFGAYENGRLGVHRQRGGVTLGGSLWVVQAAEVVLATGAIERPMLFERNDLPGAMLADAALHYLRQHGVLCGARPIVATNNDSAYPVALALAKAGAAVTVVDSRPPSARTAQAVEQGIRVLTGARIARALGRGRVTGVVLADGQEIEGDLVATSGGWTPTLHLYCQAGGKAVWEGKRAILVPAFPVSGISLAGRVAGDWASPDDLPWVWSAVPDIPEGKTRKVWIDLQNDVTLGDVQLAAQENFTSVEHLKRYTTLGMATDQGKTANLLGAAAMAVATGRNAADLGLTTYRPPYVPVPMAALAGLSKKHLQSPLRRLAAEPAHREIGATLWDYGGLLRPAFYGKDESSIATECLAARQGAVVFDASSLGKVAVMGPKAGELLDFLFAGRMSNLAPGRIRYGLTLNEAGVVTDDGVVLCLGPDHFLVSCSSSHVGGFVAGAEEWRQTRFGRDQVFVHDRTAHWATMSLSGPKAKAIMAGMGIVPTLDDAAFPHMSFVMGQFMGREARVARVSFTGERGYEISVPTGLAVPLWQAMVADGASPCGIEALGVLRAEKGFIYVGQDTDGETMPQDLGFDAPRLKRKQGFVGDRALQLPVAGDADRKQLVGLARTDGGVIPVGAHLIEGSPRRSIGFVTSSHQSPSLGRGIALALVEGGRARIGQEVTWFDLGKTGSATVTPACAYDPDGSRLHV
ncbi:MAG: (2Fe-2S)-binding protein [Tabrizicola sp.]|nr:(2Fe-2S)-binding protein [Tabrizicola sp.]